MNASLPPAVAKTPTKRKVDAQLAEDTQKLMVTKIQLKKARKVYVSFIVGTSGEENKVLRKYSISPNKCKRQKEEEDDEVNSVCSVLSS